MSEPAEFVVYSVPFKPLRWTSSPCEVCGVPAQSSRFGHTGDDAYLNGDFCDEHQPSAILRMPEHKTVTHYEGTCDVCGETLEMAHDQMDGIIDTSYDNDRGHFTWRRHGPDGPQQPDCDEFFSRVYQTGREEVPLTDEDREAVRSRFYRCR